MKRAFILKALAAGIGLAVSLWAGRAIAEEEFGTLAGVEAQAISPGEMAAVEGKLLEGLLPGNGSGNSFLGLIPNLSGGGGLTGGGALRIVDPKQGLLGSGPIQPDLGLLVLNLSGLTPSGSRPKNNPATGVLGRRGLLFNVNARKTFPLVFLQLQGLNLGGLGR